MKKLKQFSSLMVIMTALSLTPVGVYAQEVVDVSGTTDTAATDTTTSAGVPETGIAPENKVLKNSGIFLAGSVLGASAGLGVIAIRKKQTNQ